MRKIFQFLVICGLLWCFVSNEAADEENAKSADANPADPAEPATINIGAYSVTCWTRWIAIKFRETKQFEVKKSLRKSKNDRNFLCRRANEKKTAKLVQKFIHIDICTVNVFEQQTLHTALFYL